MSFKLKCYYKCPKCNTEIVENNEEANSSKICWFCKGLYWETVLLDLLSIEIIGNLHSSTDSDSMLLYTNNTCTSTTTDY